MKKFSSLAILLAFAIILSPEKTYAQNKKGKSVVTVGVASSLTGLLFKAIQNSVNTTSGTVEIKSTPGLQGMYDFGLTDRFSLGLAISYQSYSFNYTNYMYDSIPRTFQDKITRMNVGLRPLIHLGNSEDADLYLGARFGYTQWSYKTDNLDPNYGLSGQYSGSFGNNIKTQVLFGIRYFFTENIGINGEIAIGAPYFMMGGLNIKF